MKPRIRMVAVGVFAILMSATFAFADDPAGKTARAPARDLSLPIDLPVLATYKLDRPSLDDPTTEFSIQQAQGGEVRQRERKAPFVRLNLPEPFENRVEVRSAQPQPQIVAPVPQPPK